MFGCGKFVCHSAYYQIENVYKELKALKAHQGIPGR